jgi:hypothetical protein
MSIAHEFVSQEKKKYKFQLGRALASGLTGFICGAVFASIIWYVAFKLILPH